MIIPLVAENTPCSQPHIVGFSRLLFSIIILMQFGGEGSYVSLKIDICNVKKLSALTPSMAVLTFLKISSLAQSFSYSSTIKLPYINEVERALFPSSIAASMP